jgi:phosphohistidine swiveling domain-containing protein
MESETDALPAGLDADETPAVVETPATPIRPEIWDPLHAASPEGRFWSRGNIGEQLPGVVTPLTWDLWEVAAEGGTRSAFHAIGAASRAEARVPADRDERFMRAFYGRGAAQLNFLCAMGDRIPGTSGAAIAEQIFGESEESLAGARTRRRYPIIAARFPYTFLTTPSVMHARATRTAHRWRELTSSAHGMSYTDAVREFAVATAHCRETVALQAITLFAVVQPVYEALARLVGEVRVGDVTSLVSGHGSVREVAVVDDLWQASRGEIDLSLVTSRNGFHGPREGELASYMWREDDTPLQRMLAEYAAMDDAQSPVNRERALRKHRVALEHEILESLPLARRQLARLLFKTASRVVPLRSIGKDCFLQATDGVRACARRIGERLAMDGVLEHGDDIFFLTEQEIVGRRPDDIKGMVRRRRERFDYYRSIEIPTRWTGDPQPIAVSHDAARPTSVEGVGVSPGVVEGVARVVLDPADADIQAGDILVSPTTDPSWSSIIFLASALVVDLGGSLSHAAIIARELSVPCVVSTVNGTQVIRTGDRCRVDGSRGVVEILKPGRED